VEGSLRGDAQEFLQQRLAVIHHFVDVLDRK
jgi:hypothetical protein